MSSGLEARYYDLSKYGFEKPLAYYVEGIMSQPKPDFPYFSHLRWMESVMGIIVPKNQVWWTRVSESMVMHTFLREAAGIEQEEVKGLFEILPERSAPKVSIYTHEVIDGNKLASFCRRRLDDVEKPNLELVIF